MSALHRRHIVLRGTSTETAAAARHCVANLPATDVLWVTDAPADTGFEEVAPRRVRGLLGRAFDAVVLDLHGGLDADLIGQSQGFVWGGGALVLRLPPEGDIPLSGQTRFAAPPHRPSDVGRRFYALFDARLGQAPTAASPLTPCDHVRHGTAEQTHVVEQLAALFRAPTPGCAVVVADRGRGKSSALGLALARLGSPPGIRIAVSAGQRDAVREVFRFAGEGQADFVAPIDLAFGDAIYDLIVIDEAAQLPVPLLQAIVRRHPDATLAFATTARGYEGTGRGFLLRFVTWLETEPRPATTLTLTAPIRWGPDDPLEAAVFDTLLLGARPAEVTPEIDVDQVVHRVLDRDALAQDPRLLADFFGLLVHAHYRTTPGDLHRMLDAPNLRLHALLHEGRVVAATWIALEGALSPAVSDAIHWGHTRIRGHALAETLLSHSARPDAGPLRIVRSVRIAVHPGCRRRGLGTRLIDHVHQTYQPDLFGTLFGATAELLAFRRSVGYALIRVGASRGTRTGEPAAVMVRPVSAPAHALLRDLRADLARDLPMQLSLMAAGNELVLDPALEAALRHDLPKAPPLTPEAVRYTVATYAFGPRTLEAAAVALTTFIETHRDLLATLSATERVLIEGRILAHDGWHAVTEKAGLNSLPAAMRAARRAVRALVLRAEPAIADIPPAPR